MGECDGVDAVHREVAVSRRVYSARVAAQAALDSRGVFPNPSFMRLRKSCPLLGCHPTLVQSSRHLQVFQFLIRNLLKTLGAVLRLTLNRASESRSK